MKNRFPLIKPLVQINLAVAVLTGTFILALQGQQREGEQATYQPETNSNQSEEPTEGSRQISRQIQDSLGKIQQIARQVAKSQYQSIENTRSNGRDWNIDQSTVPNPEPTVHSYVPAAPIPPKAVKSVPPARVAPVRDSQFSSAIRRPTVAVVRPQAPLNPPNRSSLSDDPPPFPASTKKSLTESPPTTTARQAPLERKQESQPKLSREKALAYANDIVAGLQIADKKGKIPYGSSEYRKLQTAIMALRQGAILEQGTNLEVVARQASVPISTLEELIAWGGNRPGNSATSSDPIATASGNRTAPEDSMKAGETQGDRSIRYANDIVAGLQVADSKKEIRYDSLTNRKVQTAVALLRQGESLEIAARKAQISTETLQKLIAWGENRPGSRAAVLSSSLSIDLDN